MHKVKCAVCGATFDKDKVQAVRYGKNRHAHYSCHPEGELLPLPKKEEQDSEYKQLIEYIDKLFNKKCNFALVTKQIKTYKEKNGYSYSGILKSLVYAYEIKKNPIDKAHGIGIVPYVYQDAYNYYLSLYITQKKNDIALSQMPVNCIVIDKEVTIKIPDRKKEIKLFNFWEED